MSLLARLNDDMTAAMNAGEKERVEVLRFALAGVNAAIKETIMKTPGAPFTDEEVVTVLQKDIKRRKESVELFKQGKRADLVTKEEGDLKVLEEYVPKGLSMAEIEKEVEGLIKKGHKDFNEVMREAMKLMKGRADGKTVGDVIKKKLG